MWYGTDGDPNEEEREGGGTDGYDNPRDGAPKVIGGLVLNDREEGGLVIFVLLLRKLAGLVDVIGENGKGDSEDEGEWESGVLPSEVLFFCRRTCEGGRGIGTPCVGRDTWVGMYRTDVDADGEDENEEGEDL